MQTIIFATGNEGKMREIRDIMAGFPARFLSMKEAGIEADIVEDGNSFEENAIIKAKMIAIRIPTLEIETSSNLLLDFSLNVE